MIVVEYLAVRVVILGIVSRLSWGTLIHRRYERVEQVVRVVENQRRAQVASILSCGALCREIEGCTGFHVDNTRRATLACQTLSTIETGQGAVRDDVRVYRLAPTTEGKTTKISIIDNPTTIAAATPPSTSITTPTTYNTNIASTASPAASVLTTTTTTTAQDTTTAPSTTIISTVNPTTTTIPSSTSTTITSTTVPTAGTSSTTDSQTTTPTTVSSTTTQILTTTSVVDTWKYYSTAALGLVANSTCAKDGGRLIDITGTGKKQLLCDYVRTRKYPDIWIGMHIRLENGVNMTYSTSGFKAQLKTQPYEDWASTDPNEIPSNGDWVCVRLRISSTTDACELLDKLCSNSYTYVCEFV